MSNVFDYLKWRGDLLFSQDPPNAVDALIFSTLVYLEFAGSIVDHPDTPITLREVAEEFLALSDVHERGRGKNDIELLRRAAETQRFGFVRMFGFRNQLIPEQDTQFAAASFLLDDGSILLAFRGTDNTLTGWKEDFNMSFQQTVPAQRLALRYTGEIYAEYTAPMRLCGHSKGGNLAVFAAARSSPMVQKWILAVYNNDGPGFGDYMMGDPGYLAMVDRIHTFVPQSSIIGMLMEREEAYTIIKSTQVSLLQHDTFSWEVMGKGFVPMEKLTSDSRFLNLTIKNWLSGMNHEQRNRMVDVVFGLLETGNVKNATDIFQPGNVRSYLHRIGADNQTREEIYSDMRGLIRAARETRIQMNDKPQLPER